MIGQLSKHFHSLVVRYTTTTSRQQTLFLFVLALIIYFWFLASRALHIDNIIAQIIFISVVFVSIALMPKYESDGYHPLGWCYQSGPQTFCNDCEKKFDQ